MADLLKLNRYHSPTKKKSPAYLIFLSNYYFLILDKSLDSKEIDFLDMGDIEEISFFLKLTTKFFKTKYTITNSELKTLVTASVGMILKYYGNFRKSFKRSYRANVLLIKFVKSTILKLIQKQKYIFIVEGFNSKLFKLINIFNFLKSNTNLMYFLVQPKLCFGRRIFRKIKSIKRKIQKKNAAAILMNKKYLKKFTTANYNI
jgi:hypothetical protein